MADLEGFEAMLSAMLDKVVAVAAVTPEALDDAADTLVAVASGLLSLTSHPPGTPTPSMPGTPPSLISGALAASITATPATGDGPVWEAQVGPAGVVYARIQELGGITGAGHRTVLPPRPYMLPAQQGSTDMILFTMTQAWATALE